MRLSSVSLSGPWFLKFWAPSGLIARNVVTVLVVTCLNVALTTESKACTQSLEKAFPSTAECLQGGAGGKKNATRADDMSVHARVLCC
jgi:hypothetical protein